MAVSKVPDSVLEKVRCSCGRYLSSAPVIVCQDGQSMCSKCTNLQAPHLGTVTQNFAYEALAKVLEFPCCYKPHGCLRYVEFNKAAEHEDECLYRIYDCPVDLLSSCDKRATATELYLHYEQNHPELYLKRPSFMIDVTADFELHRLFKVDDVVLLLQTKCSTNAGKMWFNTIYFGNINNASLICYNIKLSSADDNKRVMELGLEKACSINNILMLPSHYIEIDISIAMGFLNHSELQCHWVINVPDELKNKIKNQQELEQEEMFKIKKESICCPICEIYMVPPIYRCDQNHITCIDCKGYDSQCRGCLRNDVKFTIAADLESISKSGKHHCKWKNCNQGFSYDMIRLHEQQCFCRVYKCPECSWSGIFDMFVNHFQYTHRNLNIHVANTVALNLQDCTGYVIVHREIIKFTVTTRFGMQNFEFNVHIYFLGSPTYAKYWKCEVKDNFGKVYSFSGEQYNSAININHGNQGISSTWTFGNAPSKCYSLCITKNN